MSLGYCRSCGAPVIFLLMNTGNTMPIDPGPVPNGNIVVELGVGRVLKKADARPPEGTALFRSHFATCPDAARFRHKRKG